MDQSLAIQFNQIDTWTKYTFHIHRYTKILYEPLFIGQGNKFRGAGCTDSGWRLEPSLYRKPKTSHPRFIDCVKAILIKGEYRMSPFIKIRNKLAFMKFKFYFS